MGVPPANNMEMKVDELKCLHQLHIDNSKHLPHFKFTKGGKPDEVCNQKPPPLISDKATHHEKSAACLVTFVSELLHSWQTDSESSRIAQVLEKSQNTQVPPNTNCANPTPLHNLTILLALKCNKLFCGLVENKEDHRKLLAQSFIECLEETKQTTFECSPDEHMMLKASGEENMTMKEVWEKDECVHCAFKP